MLFDFVLTKELLNKAFVLFLSYFYKRKKILLEKTCFQRGFELFKNFSFIKKNIEKASKTEISSTTYYMRASYMRELRFGNLVLALHCYSGDKK